MFNVSARVVIIHKAEKQASKFLTLGCVYTSVVKDEFSITWYVVEEKIWDWIVFWAIVQVSACVHSRTIFSGTFRGKGSLSHFSSRASPNQPSSLLCPGCSSCLDLHSPESWSPGFCCLPWYDPSVIHAAGLAGWAILQAHLPISFCSWTSHHDVCGKRLLLFK